MAERVIGVVVKVDQRTSKVKICRSDQPEGKSVILTVNNPAKFRFAAGDSIFAVVSDQNITSIEYLVPTDSFTEVAEQLSRQYRNFHKLKDYVYALGKRYDKAREIDNLISLTHIELLWRTSDIELLSYEIPNPQDRREFCRVWRSWRLERRAEILGITKTAIAASSELFDLYSVIEARNSENIHQCYFLDPEDYQRLGARQSRSPTLEDSIDFFLTRVIFSLYSGNKWMCVRSDILLKAISQLNGGALIPAVSSSLKRLIGQGHLVASNNSLYLPPLYEIERVLVDFFAKMISGPRIPLVASIKRDLLDPNLTPEQLLAIQVVLGNRLSMITGAPGTGKTVVIANLVKFLKNTPGIRVIVTSFTGKAVSRITEVLLERECETEALTMDRIIAGGKNLKDFLASKLLIIIDEFSMVAAPLMFRFIEYFRAKSNYSLAVVGDIDQLEPIGAGSLMQSLASVPELPIVRLNHNFRSRRSDGKANPIIQNCQAIQQGVLNQFHAGDNFHVLPFARPSSQEEKYAELLLLIQGLKSRQYRHGDIMVVTPYRDEAAEINRKIQQLYHVGKAKYYYSNFNNAKFQAGDLVRMVENVYSLKLMNGDQGIVQGGSGEQIYIKFDHLENPVVCNLRRMPSSDQELFCRQISLNYAVTVHLAQGSEWPVIIFFQPPWRSLSEFVNRNLVYTALSRAKHLVFVLGNVSGLIKGAAQSPSPRFDNITRGIIGKSPESPTSAELYPIVEKQCFQTFIRL